MSFKKRFKSQRTRFHSIGAATEKARRPQLSHSYFRVVSTFFDLDRLLFHYTTALGIVKYNDAVRNEYTTYTCIFYHICKLRNWFNRLFAVLLTPKPRPFSVNNAKSGLWQKSNLVCISFVLLLFISTWHLYISICSASSHNTPHLPKKQKENSDSSATALKSLKIYHDSIRVKIG